MIIMADGTFRAVVACKSINFDLMSSREREGVEFSYQNFLNALYFPIQIFIRSQRVDIGPYLDRLEEIRRNQDNMLLNVLMDDYIPVSYTHLDVYKRQGGGSYTIKDSSGTATLRTLSTVETTAVRDAAATAASLPATASKVSQNFKDQFGRL